MEERQPLHEFFHKTLLTVIGQAFTAAGYHFHHAPTQWVSGLFRFSKRLQMGQQGIIEFQVLVYTDNMWSSGMSSRFRVNLARTNDPIWTANQLPMPMTRTLSALIVEDFGIAALPLADYWWTFHDPQTLGHAIAEAGKLAIGYGMPWLSGELIPPNQLT